MMKILEISTFLRGGAGAFLTGLACEFKKRGYDVDVISSGRVGQLIDWKELLKKLNANNISHYTFNFFKRDNEIFWSEVERLAKILDKNNYDVIHSHAGVPVLACYMAQKIIGKDIPIIATFHSWGKNRPSWMNICDTWAFNRCNKVFFDSNEYMKFGKEKGIVADSEVIYPGLLFDRSLYKNREKLRRKLIETLGIPKNSRIVTNLAEITERKGQIDLIKGLYEISREREDVYVCIVGECRDKSYYNKFMDTINELGLNNKVILPGWIEDPYEIIAASDLFVFPTYSEGLGLAIVEAIVLGIPTIFSSIEGTKDIESILGNTCFGTFHPGNYKKIAQLSLNIFNREYSRLSTQIDTAISTVIDIFDFNKTADKYEEQIINIVENRNISNNIIHN